MNHGSILLIDDDIDDQLMFCEAVQDIAPTYQRVVKSNGVDALEYLQTSQILPELIFLDLNMPMMSGEECIRAIKTEERFMSIPVIVFSTFKSKEKERELKALGAAYYLQKPVEYDQLCKSIRFVISGAYKN